MSHTDTVILKYISDHIAYIRLNRPQKRNAINNAMLEKIAQYIQIVEQNTHIRCIVLTGDKMAFCAGSDIKEFASHGIHAIENTPRKNSWSCIENTPIPLIGAVSGICMGAGHELALLCDMVVVDTDAKIGQPEITLGHIPGDGATQRLPKMIGKHRAMKMILTGGIISGQDAYNMGLFTEVTAPGTAEQRAISLAKQVAQYSACALKLAKDAIKKSQDTHLSEGLSQERHNISQAFKTHDQTEGLNAFLEKRLPKFKDA